MKSWLLLLVFFVGMSAFATQPERSRSKLLVAFKKALAERKFSDEDQWQKIRVASSIGFISGMEVKLFVYELENTGIFEQDQVDLLGSVEFDPSQSVKELFDSVKAAYREQGFLLVP